MNDQRTAAADKLYESKKDGWVVALLWLAILSGIAGGVISVVMEESLLVKLPMAALMLGMAVFTWSVLRYTDYTLTDQVVKVRSGPIRWHITLEKIVEVRPTRQMWSSASLAVDRLQIRMRGERLGSFISPLDQAGFLDDLARRAPWLTREGDRLTAGAA